MGAKAVREALAAVLAPVPGLRVVGYADDVKPEPDYAVAVVWVAERGPVDVMPSAALAYRCKLLLAVAKAEPGKADDALDDLSDDVQTQLDDTDQLLWTLCTRGTYLEAFPSYTFDIEMRA